MSSILCFLKAKTASGFREGEGLVYICKKLEEFGCEEQQACLTLILAKLDLMEDSRMSLVKSFGCDQS